MKAAATVPVFLANVLATSFMCGVIWVVQYVVYPQFLLAGKADFVLYHAQHTARMGMVVALPMLVELATSGVLALFPPVGASSSTRRLLWSGFLLALLTWGVTFFVSIPLHQRLSGGFDVEACQRLIATNGIRTVLWTAHTAVVLEALRRLLTPEKPA